MRVLILGGAGMLGHKAFQVFSEQFDTSVTFRRFDERLRSTSLFPDDQVISDVDAADLDSVRRALDTARPDCVVNCIGIIKQRPGAHHPITAIQVNALFPHLLAELCAEREARLIQLGTDCVFSGRRGSYAEADHADAEDLYGRSKYLGEVGYGGALTLRTSMIGRELFTSLSLVDWLLSQRGGKVRGFTNAMYTGLTTTALSREIARVVAEYPTLTGVYHLSAEKIAKHDLLLLLRDAYGLDVEIEPYAELRCDRSLRSDRYRQATGFRPQTWAAMVQEMASDATSYDLFRQVAARR
jgi:dTDP-4-dehydrorhamnose reductase